MKGWKLVWVLGVVLAILGALLIEYVPTTHKNVQTLFAFILLSGIGLTFLSSLAHMVIYLLQRVKETREGLRLL